MAEQPIEQDQAVLFAGGERQIPSPAEEAAPAGAVRVQWIDRQQMRMAMIDVEQLIAEDHAARAIWELTGKVDLGAFYEGVRSRAGQAGRPVIDVRLLASLWIYGQSRGIHSARELEQLCQTDPAFQWLCGMEPVNYHTLSDFRVSHAAALEKLFVQVVGVLSHAGLVKLEQVMHDGTRIQAGASGSSLRRQATVEQHMEAARRQLQELEAAGEAESARRQAAARERAAEERVRRVEAARQELEKIQSAAKEPSQARVSLTDPEARVMKHAGGEYAPSYNVQISTDAAQKVIVGVELGQNASDAVLLKPAYRLSSGVWASCRDN
jgi:transposase